MIPHDAKMVGDSAGSSAGGDSDRPEPLAQPVVADQGVGAIRCAYPLACKAHDDRFGLQDMRNELG